MSTTSTKKPEQAALLEVAEAQKPQRQEETKGSARFNSPRPLREWQPDQGQLLPQYAREVLGEGHLACFFVELVKVLDFSPILGAYTKECGQPPYHPVMMTLLLMYAYARGITSSREIERRCETDLAFRYLTGGEQPDHDTVCAFRVRHLEAFRALFVDTLRVASQSGLKKVGHLLVDGTKMKANASKHKAMSYGRMDEAMKKLDEQVERLLAEAEELDAQEDERHGKGRRGDELPEELKDPKKRAERLREAARQVEAEKKVALAVEKEKRRERIGQAKQELEEQARKKAEAEGKQPEEAKPSEKARYNFTDPESRIMPKGGAFQQSYNAQVVVDADMQLVVAQAVGQSSSDARQAWRGGTTGSTRAPASGPELQGADEAQAVDEAGTQGIRATQGDGRAGDWAGEEHSPASLLVAGPAEGARRILAGVRRPQPQEDVEAGVEVAQPGRAGRVAARSPRGGTTSGRFVLPLCALGLWRHMTPAMRHCPSGRFPDTLLGACWSTAEAGGSGWLRYSDRVLARLVSKQRTSTSHVDWTTMQHVVASHWRPCQAH